MEAEVKPARCKMSHDLSTVGGQQIVSNPDPEISTKGTMWLNWELLLYPLWCLLALGTLQGWRGL